MLSNFRILLAFLLEEVSVNNDSKSYQHVIPASQRKRFSSDTILLDIPIVLLLLMMMIAILNAYKSPTCLFRWPLKKKKKMLVEQLLLQIPTLITQNPTARYWF